MPDLAALMQVFREAVKNSPLAKWLWAALAIFILVAVPTYIGIGYRAAAFGSIAVLLLLGLVYILYSLTQLDQRHVSYQAVVFSWFILVLFMGVVLLMGSSVFFGAPLELRGWITGELVKPVNPLTDTAAKKDLKDGAREEAKPKLQIVPMSPEDALPNTDGKTMEVYKPKDVVPGFIDGIKQEPENPPT